ncbi:hypothetical protein ERO13_A12G029301v2 [Gossypium hirsutum]|nr:hypothetical protein ERO13_A12G029301v2 [Gossypium hirsutum]
MAPVRNPQNADTGEDVESRVALGRTEVGGGCGTKQRLGFLSCFFFLFLG